MDRSYYTTGALYPLPGQQIFVLGGLSADKPAVSQNPRALFRKYRRFFHVYRISSDFRSLSLQIASEQAEEEIGEALEHVTLAPAQRQRLIRAAKRAMRRRQR